MRLIDFMNAFPDEANCKSKLKEYREKQGAVLGAYCDCHCKAIAAGCLSRHSPGVPSELSERVLLEVQQKELWRSTCLTGLWWLLFHTKINLGTTLSNH